MIKLKIDEGLFKVDLAPLERYVSWSPGARYFNLPPGKEHYKLLAYLASQLPPGSAVADCGTLYGCSAAALAADPHIEVVTYDTVDHIGAGARNLSESIWGLNNVRLIQGNCINAVKDIAENALITLLDIDPHDGKQEAKFCDYLICHNYKGILICDDINLNEDMRQFWSAWSKEDAVKKLNLTPWGHWSGTGAVVFDPSVIDLEVTL